MHKAIIYDRNPVEWLRKSQKSEDKKVKAHLEKESNNTEVNFSPTPSEENGKMRKMNR